MQAEHEEVYVAAKGRQEEADRRQALGGIVCQRR